MKHRNDSIIEYPKISNTTDTRNSSNASCHFGEGSDYIHFMYNIIHIVAISIFCTGLPPNLIIIYIISTVRKLRSPINKIVVSLAIADCIYLSWYLFSVLDQVYMFIPYTESLHQFFYPSIDMFMASASIVNVASLSVDRLVGCWYPLRYESMMRKKAPRIICFSWVYSITICLVAFVRIALENHIYRDIVFYVSVLMSFALPVLIVVLAYGSILFCAHQSIQRTKQLHKSINPANENVPLNGDTSLSQSNLHLLRRKNKGFFRELKVTIIILIIVLPFTIGWCFHVGIQVYEDLNGVTITDFTLNVIFNVTPSIVSSFNPYVFFMLSKSFRNELRRKLGRAIFGDRYAESGCLKRSSPRNFQSSSIQMQTMSSISSHRYSMSARGSVGGISSKAV